MAGDWIKTRTNLSGDPAVKSMSRGLKIDVFSVVGRLHEFWSWADQHTNDGVLPLMVLDDVDEVTQKRGFGAEMVRVGWLVELGSEGLSIPKWDRHNGESAKKRCMDQERQRSYRQAKLSLSKGDSVTGLSQKNCDSVAELSPQKSDQRREEKSITPISPLAGDGASDEDPLLIRAKSLFVKSPVRLPIRLDRSQLLAWKKNRGAVVETSEEDWVLLEEAYAQVSGVAFQYRRKDLAQLLNNWNGEITRAVDWKKRSGPEWRWQVQAAGKAERGGQGGCEPEGWREAVAEMFPDCDADGMEWSQLSADVRAGALDLLKKKNGGGDE